MPPRPSPANGQTLDGSGVWFDDSFLKKLERLRILAKRLAAGAARGARRSRRLGGGLDFADHRAYVPGDDLRRLDWNLYGRLERPLVRLYQEDEDLTLYLLVDSSASMGIGAPPKLALAAQTAAALAYVALSALDQVAVHTVGERLGGGIGLRRGKAQFHAALQHLGALVPAGRTDLRAAASTFVARHRRRGAVVVLSDFFDPSGVEEALDRLRYARFSPVAVQITAPEEAAPELANDVLIVDIETGAEQELTVTPAVRHAYKRRYEARLEALDRFCGQRAIPCFQTLSSTPFEELVLRLFRSGGFLV